MHEISMGNRNLGSIGLHESSLNNRNFGSSRLHEALMSNTNLASREQLSPFRPMPGRVSLEDQFKNTFQLTQKQEEAP